MKIDIENYFCFIKNYFKSNVPKGVLFCISSIGLMGGEGEIDSSRTEEIGCEDSPENVSIKSEITGNENSGVRSKTGDDITRCNEEQLNGDVNVEDLDVISSKEKVAK